MKSLLKKQGLKTALGRDLLVILILAVAAITVYAGEITPDIFKGLRYRNVCPPGNRTAAVVGEPGNPLVYYIGASSGGVWKSEDGATTWRPVFDKQEAQSTGALAVAPSDPTVVWGGTGEAFVG